MQNNPESGAEHFSTLKDENLRLLSENAHLKKDLERESIYHKNLFQQWKELNEVTVVKDRELSMLKSASRKGIPKPAFYSVLGIVVLLAAFDAYHLFFDVNGSNKANQTPAIVMIDSLPVTNIKSKEFNSPVNQPVNPEPAPLRKDITNDTANYQKSVPPPIASKTAADDNAGGSGETLKAVAKKNSASATEATLPVKEATVKNPLDSITTNKATPALYKVRSKAYLYDNPDEASRRNAFIIHWDNEYGKLTALAEKNGFIYIEFKNHLGQLAKGWVRKIDLDRI